MSEETITAGVCFGCGLALGLMWCQDIQLTMRYTLIAVCLLGLARIAKAVARQRREK